MDTTHGWHIPGTYATNTAEVPKCGGDGICTTCSSEMALYAMGVEALKAHRLTEDRPTDITIVAPDLAKAVISEMNREPLFHDDGTMQKVYEAMKRFGLDDVDITDIVNAMQNNGIYFRECAGKSRAPLVMGDVRGVLQSSLAGLDKPEAGRPVSVFDTDHLRPYIKADARVSERYYREKQNREVGDPVDYVSEARRHVRKFIEDHNTSGHDLPKFGLYVPLFAYILGSWKATVSTDTDNVLPEAYFEVTHKASTGETFVVQYNKFASDTYFD